MEKPRTALSAHRSPVPPDDFARSFESAYAKFRAAIETAYEAEAEWPLRAASAIRATLEFAVENPIAAQTLTVDSLAQAGGDLTHRRPVDRLARLFADGRDSHPDGEGLPSLLEDALAGGISCSWSSASRWATRGR
jgi:hypothetical protein